MTGVTVILRVEVPDMGAPVSSPAKSKKADRPQITKASAAPGNSIMVFAEATGWDSTPPNLIIKDEQGPLAEFHVGDVICVYFTEAV